MINFTSINLGGKNRGENWGENRFLKVFNLKLLNFLNSILPPFFPPKNPPKIPKNPPNYFYNYKLFLKATFKNIKQHTLTYYTT